jgi:diguanylate cyclase (GGDEF)-like protein
MIASPLPDGSPNRLTRGMRRFAWVASGYGVSIALLVLAYAAGLMSGLGTLLVLLPALAANVAFFTLLRNPRGAQPGDPELIWPQVLAALAIACIGLYHFDYDRGLALLVFFPILAIGLFRFGARDFLLAAGLVILGYAAVTGLLFWLKPTSIDVQRQAFHLLVLSLALPAYGFFGARVNELGRQVRPAYQELSTAVATIEQMARHDRLTGLANRGSFAETLSRAIANAERHQRSVGVLMLDLDRFKNVNDTLGHGIGDRVLQETARRLLATMRSGDFVARLGGDEFVMLVEDDRGRTELADVAARILYGFKPTFRIDGRSLAMSASIGICTFPDGATDCESMLSNADIALYRAKEQGRNRFCFYSADLNRLSQERLSLEAAMARALDNDEFEVWYQPKIAIRTGKVKGAEALLRWRHPEHGLLMPGRFVPLAEESGLIEAIDLWAVKHVCERARHWREQGQPLPPIAVNLSANQLHRADLVDALATIFSETQATPDTVELEITETAVMRDPERAVAVMEGLKGMGVRLAIDDFGMGHSSLGYLKRFPVDMLKIDRTFIKDLPDDRDDVAITRAIIAMAHSLKVSVVAEGVERQDQFEVLRNEGCDQYQGFFCQPALREDDLIRFLEQSASARGIARRRSYAAPADPPGKKQHVA